MKRLELILVEMATLSIIILALLIFADVAAVVVFNSYIPDVVIIARELMVLAIILPLAATTSNKAHISVEVIANLMPEKVVKRLITFGYFFAAVAIVPLTFVAIKDLVQQVDTGELFYGDLQLPVWPGRLAFSIGMTMCLLRLITLFVGDFMPRRKNKEPS